MYLNKANESIVKAFERTKKLMVKLVVEQLRQLILTHHSSQQLKNPENGKSAEQANKKKAISICLLRVDTQYKSRII